jgi:lipoyl(octanoyl) transferase
LLIYTLLDLQRRGWSVKRLVDALEQAVIDFLAERNVAADRRPGAPGVYVAGRKIAALGLRVRRGCSYHGLALNVAMDLTPFRRINPCGYPGLEVTQTADCGVPGDVGEVAGAFVPVLVRTLGDTPMELSTRHAISSGAAPWTQIPANPN